MSAGNEPWADTVKRLKKTGRNKEIVAICKENLPFPDAFGEMAIALRKQIRDRRKNKQRFNDLLRQLHRAAVWQNFFADIDALGLRDPAESSRVAGQFIPRIKCDYNLIGYEHLDMLGVNDVKWIVDAWGEPKNHSQARRINQELHAQTAARYKLEKEREQRSAGRLFGGQQLKLIDPAPGGDGQPERQDPEDDAGQKRGAGFGNRSNRTAALLIVAVLSLALIVIMLVT